MYADLLNTDQYRDLASRIPTVIVPVGSHEAHGRHCALGTDAMIPRRLCADIEARIGERVLIAPLLPYGYTPLLAEFPGTVSIGAETLIALYADIGIGLAKWGARNIVFMNGHGGNIPLLTIACDRIAAAGATAHAISYWATYSREILTVCDAQGHAGEDETSLVLAIDEALVDRSKMTRHMKKAFAMPLSGPGMKDARFPDAMNGDATKASTAKGEKLYALMLELNLRAIERIEKGQYTDDIA
jgi:creatinine amidohydrolase